MSPSLPALTQGEGDLVTHAQQLPKIHLLLRGMDPKLHHPASQALALGKHGDRAARPTRGAGITPQYKSMALTVSQTDAGL